MGELLQVLTETNIKKCFKKISVLKILNTKDRNLKSSYNPWKICVKFISSKFSGLQGYSRKLYLQMNSFTGIFHHHFKPPPCPLIYWLKPPIKFWRVPPSPFNGHSPLNTYGERTLLSKRLEIVQTGQTKFTKESLSKVFLWSIAWRENSVEHKVFYIKA